MSNIKKLIRYGEALCPHCNVMFLCKDLEQHIIDKHPDKSSMCFFCGNIEVKKNASNQFTHASNVHLIACCGVHKRITRKKRNTKKRTYIEMSSTTNTSCVRDISSKDIQNDRGQVIGVVDSEVFVDEKILRERISKRTLYLEGDEYEKLLANNVHVPGIDAVLTFWNTFNFAPPPWLMDLFEGDPLFLNRLEFHENANIDTIWARAFGHDELDFYHVFVHMCVFGRFVNLVRELYNICTLLRYACVCDKHARDHVHFVLVSKKRSLILTHLNTKTMGGCHITKTRNSWASHMKNLNLKIEPSWPDHRHFHMRAINSAMHLFNTINYICNRSSNMSTYTKSTTDNRGDMINNSVAVNRGGTYHITNVKSPQQHKLAVNVHKFIASYVTDLDYRGSHLYIFRPIYPDAPMWFTAVSRRGMLEYVEYCMNKRSIEDKVNIVIRSGHSSLHLKYRDIMEYLIQSAVPLKADQYIHHNLCIDGEKRSIKDDTKYIYLGKNEYVHVSRLDYACCNEYSREVFFDSQPETMYMLNRRHRTEFALYQKWMTQKDETIKQKTADNLLLSQKLQLYENENSLLRELRNKDEIIIRQNSIISEKDKTIIQLRKQLSHFSNIITKKKGPYLESNDKSNV